MGRKRPHKKSKNEPVTPQGAASPDCSQPNDPRKDQQPQHLSKLNPDQSTTTRNVAKNRFSAEAQAESGQTPTGPSVVPRTTQTGSAATTRSRQNTPAESRLNPRGNSVVTRTTQTGSAATTRSRQNSHAENGRNSRGNSVTQQGSTTPTSSHASKDNNPSNKPTTQLIHKSKLFR